MGDALMAVDTGAFHVGVEVYGSEWSYCYVRRGTGILDNALEARSKHHFRKSLDVGTTNLSQEEVMRIIAELSEEWLGCDYDLLRKNCVSFSVVLVEKLGAGPIPTWASNLARACATSRATLLAGVTLLDPSQQAATARSMAIVAVAKAGEMDAQHNVCGMVKATMVDMIETTLSLSWHCSGAAALQPNSTICWTGLQRRLTQQHRCSSSRLSDAERSITEQAENKFGELDETKMTL